MLLPTIIPYDKELYGYKACSLDPSVHPNCILFASTKSYDDLLGEIIDVSGVVSQLKNEDQRPLEDPPFSNPISVLER